ncbi:MAG: flagellar biosynthesis protein FlhF [Gammaproteobacteria bacterium (ex Lamellibrachia satsuma)]|nr:MAG: flagellar biosynthesis protein FlhF [Gammaproteobacteria bacterium (ex Lamellibrachia satsuma)]RRS34602.1 MAG: flagellar biosynthesis protein FlhF [Gammaproteobacteria bacterium (ex Lamellibrachia satsuma)]RRS37407.1 MAG: flagellar biosynthesis protein FlhF [Gammaproteobacteria bacterium (ex Lamellibrachia satsuma)]
MKIKRFFAPDMRQALKSVRDTLGSDAVILSNKSVEGGVELVAAMDYDVAAFNDAATDRVTEIPRQNEPQAPVAAEPKRAVRPAREPNISEKPVKLAEPVSIDRARHQTSQAQPQPQVEWSQDPVLQEMRQEMQALRRMMENELSELTWRDMGQRRPQTQELIRRLMGMGLGADLCRDLAGRVEDMESEDQAWRKALFHLISELPVVQEDILDMGGVVALVGPTGVGKTTTIAKLAARFCLRHGNRQLALITTDSYRIGAQEQLHNYGRILDVPVRTASTAEELDAALRAFSEKRLVLIDTAGMSQQDIQLSQRLSMITSGNHPVRTLLTLSAATQRSALAHAIRAFSIARPVGCILTKMDEAASLGGVFSTLIDTGLPLAFVTDGQRVPEDLHVARAHSLVSRAMEMAQEADESPDEGYMAFAFGGTGEHAHV